MMFAVERRVGADWQSVVVRARKHRTNEPLRLDAGDYEFRAQGRWYDLFIGSGPAGYDAPWLSVLQRLMERSDFRRLPRARWFALCGVVQVAGDHIADYEFVVGGGGRFSLPAGSLYLFANDACGWYWNNFGRVSVELRQVR